MVWILAVRGFGEYARLCGPGGDGGVRGGGHWVWGPDPAGWVVVDHPTEAGSGATVYGHVVREVAVGDRVVAGQRIAHVNPDSGTNGGVAPHMHFEVHPWAWQAGSQIDPLPWLGDSPGLAGRTLGV